MSDTIIHKSHLIAEAANMSDYEQARASFSWEEGQSLLDGLPNGKLNIAHEAIDRHVQEGIGDRLAIRWIAKDGMRLDFTYLNLQRQTARFANVLRGLGVQKGARIYTLLGRKPELYITALGTLKAGCVFCPMFSAFGPEPLAQP